MTDHVVKDALNVFSAHAFSKRAGVQLDWYHAKDKHAGQQITDNALLSELQNLHTGLTNYCMGVLPNASNDHPNLRRARWRCEW